MSDEPGSADLPLTVGQCGALASLFEAAASKPGNVHRGADFHDLSFPDLAASGVLIAPHLDRAAAGEPLGRVIYDAVVATRSGVATNSNLGIILLLVPLAAAQPGAARSASIAEVLGRLTAEDADWVYRAIAHARPGGLGKVAEADVGAAPPASLIDAMRLAADRDRVARQYADNFSDVLEVVVPTLARQLGVQRSIPDAIVLAFLELLARWPDSLIARKCGTEQAARISAHAQSVLDLRQYGLSAFLSGLGELDFYLRADGNRRNPGTTADLLAAGLFVALQDGIISRPWRLTTDFVVDE